MSLLTRSIELSPPPRLQIISTNRETDELIQVSNKVYWYMITIVLINNSINSITSKILECVKWCTVGPRYNIVVGVHNPSTMFWNILLISSGFHAISYKNAPLWIPLFWSKVWHLYLIACYNRPPYKRAWLYLHFYMHTVVIISVLNSIWKIQIIANMFKFVE